ncbi:MAG: DUF4215 domain-containing protein [Patescibacteria group bacterium]|jgi:cysteine-rich repeat protein
MEVKTLSAVQQNQNTYPKKYIAIAVLAILVCGLALVSLFFNEFIDNKFPSILDNFRKNVHVGNYVVPKEEYQKELEFQRKFQTKINKINDDNEIIKITEKDLLRNKIIEETASAYNLVVTNEEIEKVIKDRITTTGGESQYLTLISRYGWTIDDAKEKIKSQILEEKTRSYLEGYVDAKGFFYFLMDESSNKARNIEIIEHSSLALNQLQSGESFEEVVEALRNLQEVKKGDFPAPHAFSEKIPLSYDDVGWNKDILDAIKNAEQNKWIQTIVKQNNSSVVIVLRVFDKQKAAINTSFEKWLEEKSSKNLSLFEKMLNLFSNTAYAQSCSTAGCYDNYDDCFAGGGIMCTSNAGCPADKPFLCYIPATIKGRVIDSVTGQLVTGASISISDSGSGGCGSLSWTAIFTADGNYEQGQFDCCRNPHTFTATHPECTSQTATINLANGATVTHDFYLVCTPGSAQCNEHCTDNSDCTTGYCHYAYCRNSACPSESDCTCSTGPICGNGILETGEGCDDGNTVSGDGCSSVCQLEDTTICGDGKKEGDEGCDDGNTISGDGCSSVCQLEGVCAPDESRFCTNTDYCYSAQVGGYTIPTPADACEVDGDVWCCAKSEEEDPKNPEIKLKILNKNTKVGEPVRMQVYQKPAHEDDHHCYYKEIEVKLVTAPDHRVSGGYHVCTAKGFGPDSRTQECIWETKNTHHVEGSGYETMPVMPYPEGYYEAKVDYGGHDPGSGCDDGQTSSTDSTTLSGEDPRAIYEPYEPSNQSCSPDKEEIDITDQVLTTQTIEFQTLDGWAIHQGYPEIVAYYGDCNLRNRDGCYGNCATIQSDYNPFLHVVNIEGDTSKRYTDYVVSRTISGLEEGEYLVELVGHGISAKLAGHSDDHEGKSMPHFQTITGGLMTNYYSVSEDFCQWQKGRIKTLVQNGNNSLDIYLYSKTVYDKTNVDRVPQSAFDNLRVYYCQACLAPEKPEVIFPMNGQFVSEESHDSGKIIYQVDMNDDICAQSRDNPNEFQYRYREKGEGDWPNDYVSCGPSTGKTGDFDEYKCQFGMAYTPGETYEIQGRAHNGYHWTESDVTEFTFSSDPWYQIQTGSIHADNGNIKSEIPSTAAPSNLFTGSGVATRTHSVPAALGKGSYGDRVVSANAGKYATNRPDFSFWYDKLEDELTVWNGETLPGESGFYQLTGPDIGEFTVSAGKYYVVLVDGDVSIDGDITVAPNGALLLIASGTITVGSEVKELHGFYFSDSEFIVKSNGEPDANHEGTDKQFTLEGGVVAWGGVSLGRDLGTRLVGLSNHRDPAEEFVYRVDIFRKLRTIDQLKVFKYTWQEVAP